MTDIPWDSTTVDYERVPCGALNYACYISRSKMQGDRQQMKQRFKERKQELKRKTQRVLGNFHLFFGPVVQLINEKNYNYHE